jgi:hypothetical protein
MGQVLRDLRNEYNKMPEYHLKHVAIASYGLNKKQISQMDKGALIESMLAIEFSNAYK